MTDWQLDPAVAAGLENLGWRRDEPETRDVIPAVLRGANVVAVLPPAPAWASPVIAALMGRETGAGPVLVLAAPAMLREWALAAGALLETTSLKVDVATGTAGPSPDTQQSDLVIASPESALQLHSRSGLHPERFRAIVFAWPEQWAADAAITALLQDFPKESQRVVLTANRERLDGPDGLVERYARKALVVGEAVTEQAPTSPKPTSVRTIPSSWNGRAATLAAVTSTIRAGQVTIWTADTRDHQLIRRTLGSLRDGLSIATRATPASGMVICYDPPSARQLAELSAAGETLLLVPSGTETHAARIAPGRRPMQAQSAADELADRDAALRARITTAIESGDQAAGLYALAPLFERHDPQSVAAALFTLWREAGAARPAAEPAPRAVTISAPVERAEANPAVAKIWIGAGKKDDATVADFVAVLVREVGVDRARIGRIELRDTFALVEVPAADADAIVQRLSGITIRKRKLTARVDQGRGAPPKRR